MYKFFIVMMSLVLLSGSATANVFWPGKKGNNYNVDYDFKVSGKLNRVYLHAMINGDKGATYFGVNTDTKGKPYHVVFTSFFSADDFKKKHFIVPKSGNGLTCNPDNNIHEGPGYVSCLKIFPWKLNHWYRFRLWKTGDTTAADGYPLHNWTAWLIELGPKGQTVKETQIATMSVPTNWLTSARYSSVERIGVKCDQMQREWKGNILIGFPYFNNHTSVAGMPTRFNMDLACKKDATVKTINNELYLNLDYP